MYVFFCCVVFVMAEIYLAKSRQKVAIKLRKMFLEVTPGDFNCKSTICFLNKTTFRFSDQLMEIKLFETWRPSWQLLHLRPVPLLDICKSDTPSTALFWLKHRPLFVLFEQLMQPAKKSMTESWECFRVSASAILHSDSAKQLSVFKSGWCRIVLECFSLFYARR